MNLRNLWNGINFFSQKCYLNNNTFFHSGLHLNVPFCSVERRPWARSCTPTWSARPPPPGSSTRPTSTPATRWRPSTCCASTASCATWCSLWARAGYSRTGSSSAHAPPTSTPCSRESWPRAGRQRYAIQSLPEGTQLLKLNYDSFRALSASALFLTHK